MAYDDCKRKEDCVVSERGIEEVGLVAGRSQREKKRSYKDLLREEEEIAVQVRKSSKKRQKESEVFFLSLDSHKKKKKHSADSFYYGDLSPLEPPKKKKKLLAMAAPTDTAMGLLKAITSPTATVPKPSKKTEKSPYTSVFPHYSEGRKEHKKKSASGSNSGAHELPLPSTALHKPKKMKPLFVNTETLTLREAEGLKVKLILSPKEKAGAGVETFPYPGPSASKKPPKKSSQGKSAAAPTTATPGIPPRDPRLPKPARKKHKSEAQVGLGFGPEPAFYPEARGSGVAEYELAGLEPPLDSGSSSGGELEAGELVIDDSYREVKKKKKSKKSKKKKHKEKKQHSKSKRALPLSPGEVVPTAAAAAPTATHMVQATMGAPYSVPVPPTPPTIFHSDGQSEKKKKKEEKEKEKGEKPEKKKKNMSAYQVFSKEYRVNIVAEHPGIDFGELSRKLAEVWKQLPEKDKLVWKQKAQYLQHKQIKAEATTVKRKLGSADSSSKAKGPSGSLSSHKKSPSGSMTLSSSPAKIPETEPIDVAAHLQLLGESLSLIGHRLQETEVRGAVKEGECWNIDI
uniref:HMG-box containing 4 n=1 Tax=Latimeria chalumnae TaxID=7897 RepID=H2ZRM9_LATCH